MIPSGLRHYLIQSWILIKLYTNDIICMLQDDVHLGAGGGVVGVRGARRRARVRPQHADAARARARGRARRHRHLPRPRF